MTDFDDEVIASAPPRAVAGTTGARGVVHVVRHGEVYNPDHVLYGRLPGFRLSDLGVEQATRTAHFLATRDIGYIVSSPLQRALETAAPLAGLTGLPVAQDDRLIEAENSFQGQQVAGGTRKILAPRNLPLLRNPMRPSWGEPYAQIADRMLAAVLDAVHEVAELSADGDGPRREAVCVTHQLPVVALRRFVEGQHLWHNPKRRQAALASVTTLTFGDGTVAVEYREPAGATASNAIPGA